MERSDVRWQKEEKQMRETLYCPYCKRPGVLRPAAYVYGDNNLDPEKYLYVCSGYPSCDSYIGAHKKVCVPWEPWLTAICVISGSKHTELWMQSGKWLYDQTQHIYLASEPFESPGKGHTYREIFLLPV